MVDHPYFLIGWIFLVTGLGVNANETSEQRDKKEVPGMVSRIFVLVGLLILMTSAVVNAETLSTTSAGQLVGAQENSSQGYYSDDPKQGWWWYKDPPNPKPAEEKKEKKPENKRRMPDMKDYSMEQLWSMHPDDFQELLLDFQKKAVQTLKAEDVKDYRIVMDIARRKALAYTNVDMYVAQTNPQLSLEKESPVSQAGTGARLRMQEDDKNFVLARSRDDFALVYFTSPDCSYCSEQDRIMQYFINKHGWTVKRVDFRSNPGMAAKFNITQTPSLILIAKGEKDSIPISSGVLALPTIEERVYRGVRLIRKEITPQDYATYEYQRGGAMDPMSILPSGREK